MTFRFEFDPVNKILLTRIEGRLTDELFAEPLRAFWKYWAATDASASIVDFSSVAEFALSSSFIRGLANRQGGGELNARPRVIVAPADLVFGLSRMYQILGERKQPNVKVVRTLDAALVELGAESPHFEPLD